MTSPSDYKKYQFARGVYQIQRVQEIIDAIDIDPGDSEDLSAVLDNARAHLELATFTDNGDQSQALKSLEHDRRMRTHAYYDDGRPVCTDLVFGAGEDDHVTHVWHPYPGYISDQPGMVHEFSRGPYPYRWDLYIIVAPGVISIYKRNSKIDEQEELEMTDSGYRLPPTNTGTVVR